jgi:hypothetical protein
MDECILYFTSLCGEAVCQISDSLNSVESLTDASTEISDFGADVNNRAPLNHSAFTRQVQLGQGTISKGITLLWMFGKKRKLNFVHGQV